MAFRTRTTGSFRQIGQHYPLKIRHARIYVDETGLFIQKRIEPQIQELGDIFVPENYLFADPTATDSDRKILTKALDEELKDTATADRALEQQNEYVEGVLADILLVKDKLKPASALSLTKYQISLFVPYLEKWNIPYKVFDRGAGVLMPKFTKFPKGISANYRKAQKLLRIYLGKDRKSLNDAIDAEHYEKGGLYATGIAFGYPKSAIEYFYEKDKKVPQESGVSFVYGKGDMAAKALSDEWKSHLISYYGFGRFKEKTISRKKYLAEISGLGFGDYERRRELEKRIAVLTREQERMVKEAQDDVDAPNSIWAMLSPGAKKIIKDDIRQDAIQRKIAGFNVTRRSLGLLKKK